MIKRLLLLGACALALGVLARYFNSPTPAVADVLPGREPTLTPTGNGRLRWEAVWTQVVPNLTDAALASDGSNVAWVDTQGAVRRIATDTHRTVWQTPPLPRMDTVQVTPQGTVIAYSRLNPGQTSLRILDSVQGMQRSVLLPVQGAIWSVGLTPDGTKAVVGTGAALLYLFPLQQKNVFAGTPVTLPGIPESLDVASATSPKNMNTTKPNNIAAPLAVMGTWQDGGVCAWGLDQTPKWRHDEATSDYSYSVMVSEDGSTVVATAARGPYHTEARLHAWDAHTGRLLFIEDLHGSCPKAAVSGNGQKIAVTYHHTLPGNAPDAQNGDTPDRKLMLFDRTGQRLFEEKGGVFFAPELVGLSKDGTRLLVRDPQGTIWTLDSQGRTVARLTAPDKSGELRRVIPTRDGNFLLTYRGDGSLTLYRAMAQ